MPATSARLSFPSGVALDRDTVYISDSGNDRIVKVDPDGRLTTVAGTGQRGRSGDGGPALEATLDTPWGLVVDVDGSLVFADAGNHRVRAIRPDGLIETVAGTGEEGYSGDGGPATSAELSYPYGVAIRSGTLYITDAAAHVVRTVDADGTMATLVGEEAAGRLLDTPYPIAVANDGTVYFTDTGNSRILTVDPDGTVSVFAGASDSGSGSATDVELSFPGDVAIGPDGTVYIADTGNHAVRALSVR